MVEGADRLLSMEEPESGVLAREALERDGVTFRTGVHAKQVGYAGDTFTVTLDDGVRGHRREAAGGNRAPGRHRRPRPGQARARPEGPAGSRWTSTCGPATRCGRSATSPASARSPTSRCTRPTSRSATSSAGAGRADRELPRDAAGDLHRPGDRRGRADREAGPGRRAGRADRDRPRSRRRPAAGSTRPATRASSSWSPTTIAACWSARPAPARPAARCSARSRSRCTRAVPVALSATDDLRVPDLPPGDRGGAEAVVRRLLANRSQLDQECGRACS